MSWVKIWVHLVFTTKNRVPYLTESIRRTVFKHLKENAIEKNIWLDCVNGYTEHAHCLISLGKEQSISEVAHLIKGESSFWINKQKLCKEKLYWQDDYWAVSVSESHLWSVRKYIHNQEEHHRVKTFTEEVDTFMKKYGWELIKD